MQKHFLYLLPVFLFSFGSQFVLGKQNSKTANQDQVNAIIHQYENASPEQLRQLLQNSPPAINSPIPQQSKTGLWRKGIPSQVDLKCLQLHQSNEQHEITKKLIITWLQDCRIPKDHTSCILEAEQGDAACRARAETYYPYEMDNEFSRQIEKLCRIQTLKCPVQNNDD